MNSRSRHQEYRYQYKTVAIANALFCGSGPTLNVAVPDNLLDLKAIFMHAVFRFDASVNPSNRRILWAGGEYPKSSNGNPDPTKGNMRFVNILANSTTRIADLKIDITDLKEGIMDDPPVVFDQPTMELNILTDIDGGFDIQGEIVLWKIDFVYTTTGIQ